MYSLHLDLFPAEGTPLKRKLFENRTSVASDDDLPLISPKLAIQDGGKGPRNFKGALFEGFRRQILPEVNTCFACDTYVGSQPDNYDLMLL